MLLVEESTQGNSVGVTVEWTSLCNETRQKAMLFEKQCAHRLQTVLGAADVIVDENFIIPNATSRFRLLLATSVLQADGAVFDACLLSCIAVLKRMELPVVEIDADQRAEMVVGFGDGKPIALNAIPLALTVGRFEDVLIIDPTEREASFADAILSVVVDANGDVLSTYRCSHTSYDDSDVRLDYVQTGVFDVESIERCLCLSHEWYQQRSLAF